MSSKFFPGETIPLDLEKGSIWVQTDAYPRIRSFSEDYDEIRIDAIEFPTILDLYGEHKKETYDIVDGSGNVITSFELASISPTTMGDQTFTTHAITPSEKLDGNLIPEDGELYLDFRGTLPTMYVWIHNGEYLEPFKTNDLKVRAENSIYMEGERLIIDYEGDKKSIPLMASSLDEVIENLEAKGNNVTGGVVDAISEITGKMMQDGIKKFNDEYGKELERLLKIKDIERNAEIIEKKTRQGITERKNREGGGESRSKFDYLTISDINLDKNYITISGREGIVYTEEEKIGILYRESIPTFEITFSHEVSATNIDKPILGLEDDIELHVSGQSLTIPHKEFLDKRLSLDAVAEKITKYLKTIEPTFSCTATKHKLLFRQFGSDKFGPTSGIYANKIKGLEDIVRQFGVQPEYVEKPWKPERIEKEVTIRAVVKDTKSNRVLLFIHEQLTGHDAMYGVSVAIAPFITSDHETINVKTAKMVYNSRLFGLGVKQLFNRGGDTYSGLYVTGDEMGDGIPAGIPYISLPSKNGKCYLLVNENGIDVYRGGDYKPSIEYHTVEVIGGETTFFEYDLGSVKMVTVAPHDSSVDYRIEEAGVTLEAPYGLNTKAIIKLER